MNRVVHVTTAHSPLDNRIFRKECTALSDAGFDVSLVAVAPRDHEVDGVQIVALRAFTSRWRRMLLGPRNVWQALQRLQPDVVHVHDPELIPVAVLWRWRHRAAVVYDAHEELQLQVLGKPYLPRAVRPLIALAARLLEATADRHLDGIVAATPAIAGNYRHAAVVLVQNYPWLRDYPTVQPVDASSSDVAYVGVIAEARGALEMIRAVQSSQRQARLVLAGPVASATLLKQIEEASETTRYLGQLSPAAIPAVLADTRLGLCVLHPLPNYLEAQATKLFEYMAAGRPFIASDFPFWRSLLEPHGCGLFVDPLNVEALTLAIDTLLGDEDLTLRMGERGRAAVIEHFCFEVEAKKLVTMTAEFCANSHIAGPLSSVVNASGSAPAAARVPSD